MSSQASAVKDSHWKIVEMGWTDELAMTRTHPARRPALDPSPGCAAVGGLGGGVTICNHYKDSPIPAGYDSNGCWTSTDYFATA